jgi:hypothetical protein
MLLHDGGGIGRRRRRSFQSGLPSSVATQGSGVVDKHACDLQIRWLVSGWRIDGGAAERLLFALVAQRALATAIGR